MAWTQLTQLHLVPGAFHPLQLNRRHRHCRLVAFGPEAWPLARAVVAFAALPFFFHAGVLVLLWFACLQEMDLGVVWVDEHEKVDVLGFEIVDHDVAAP